MEYLYHIVFTVFTCAFFIFFSDLFKRIPIPTRLLLFYTVINAVFFIYSDRYTQVSARLVIAQSLTFFSFQVIAIFGLSKKRFKQFGHLLHIIVYITSTIVIFKKLSGFKPYGVGLNASTEGTFLAIMMPFVLFKSYLYNKCKIIPVIAVIATGSTMGIAGSLLSVFTYLFITNKKQALKLFGASSLLIPIYFYFFNSNFHSSSGRWQQWEITVNYFLKSDFQTFGSGLGMYEIYGPYIQRLSDSSAKHLFLNAHSDWLQILFELGVTGLILSIISFLLLLKKSYKDPVLFSSIVTFGVLASMNMPLRYAATSLTGLYLIRATYQERKKLI